MKGRSEGGRAEVSRREAGASHSVTRLGDRWRSWLGNHRLVAADSLRRLLAAPGASLMTWLVIGIALALPGGLYVALANLEKLSAGWDGAAQISLFLKRDTAEDRGRELTRTLATRSDVEATQYISREQALAEFRELSGYGTVLESLEENPLPAVIVVRPLETDISAAATEALYRELGDIAEVDRAVLDLEWVQRLYGMMALGRRLTLALGALLALGVLLVVGNTIRLAIENRRDEILVVKLVGATDAFVRRPFLYTGIWYGLGGGLLAWVIIQISLLWLGGPVAELTELYQSEFSVRGLGFGTTLLLWGGSALLGWLGAWVAVGRHLGAIEPR